MITFAERALSYTSGLDRSAFVADRLRYDATLRNLELIVVDFNHVISLPKRIGNSRRCAIYPS